MTLTRWGDGELEVIRRMWAEGHTASHISNTLGEAGFNRSRSAVIGIAHRLGFKRDVPKVAAAAPAEAKTRAERKRSVEKAPRPVRRASPPPPPPPPEEPEPEPVAAPAPRPLPPAGGVALMDLERWHCRYVVREAPTLFCGAPQVFGTSYCADCAPRVFTPDGMERLRAGRKPPQRVKAAA